METPIMEARRLEIRSAYWTLYCLNRLLANPTTEGNWKLEEDMAEFYRRVYGEDGPL